MAVSIYKMCQLPNAPLTTELIASFCSFLLSAKSPTAPAPHFLHSFSESDSNGAKVEQLEPGLVPAVRFFPPKQESHRFAPRSPLYNFP